MFQINCADVSMSMPGPLAQRMEALMIEMYGEYLPGTCGWRATGATPEEALDNATEHVRTEHHVRSWPPEFWVHMRQSIRET